MYGKIKRITVIYHNAYAEKGVDIKNVWQSIRDLVKYPIVCALTSVHQ